MTPDPSRKIGEPMLGVASVSVVERSPTGIALLGQNLVRIALAVQVLAGAAGGIFALFLPQPWAVTGAAISGTIFAACSIVTGAGPGVRTQAGAAPVVAPKVGPPI